MTTKVKIGGGGKQIYLRHGSFRWPWQCTDAIWSASPDAAWLTPYCPGSRQGDNNTTIMQNVPILLAVMMAIAMRRYYTAHIAQWRRFVAFMEATKHCHQASTHSDIIKGTHQLRLFWKFHQEKGLKLTCWPLITIGVWHIKLMRST